MSPRPAATRSSAGLQLPLPPEPTGLKRASKVMAEEAPRHAMSLLTDPDWVAAHLWQGWGPQLEQAGIDRQAFLATVAEYRRELWYWAWGNRTWAHCTQGLAGRLARRATPTATSPSDEPADAPP